MSSLPYPQRSGTKHAWGVQGQLAYNTAWAPSGATEGAFAGLREGQAYSSGCPPRRLPAWSLRNQPLGSAPGFRKAPRTANTSRRDLTPALKGARSASAGARG
jgi:hypothetical protein